MKKILQQRYINKKDIHTQKTIEIIGKKKYKKLLKAGVVAVGYEILQQQQEHRSIVKQKYETTIVQLSTLLSRMDAQRKSDRPSHQSRLNT